MSVISPAPAPEALRERQRHPHTPVHQVWRPPTWGSIYTTSRHLHILHSFWRHHVITYHVCCHRHRHRHRPYIGISPTASSRRQLHGAVAVIFTALSLSSSRRCRCHLLGAGLFLVSSPSQQRHLQVDDDVRWSRRGFSTTGLVRG